MRARERARPLPPPPFLIRWNCFWNGARERDGGREGREAPDDGEGRDDGVIAVHASFSSSRRPFRPAATVAVYGGKERGREGAAYAWIISILTYT